MPVGMASVAVSVPCLDLAAAGARAGARLIAWGPGTCLSAGQAAARSGGRPMLRVWSRRVLKASQARRFWPRAQVRIHTCWRWAPTVLMRALRRPAAAGQGFFMRLNIDSARERCPPTSSQSASPWATSRRTSARLSLQRASWAVVSSRTRSRPFRNRAVRRYGRSVIALRRPMATSHRSAAQVSSAVVAIPHALAYG